jgi:hypothetical protein
MDYLQALLRVLVVASLIVLSACTGESDGDEPMIAPIELTSDSLQILGSPPTTIYYDSPYSYNLGAAGGTGAYKLSYIKFPDNISEDITVTSTPNPVDMTIQNISSSLDNDDAIKPQFKLEAVVSLPENVDAADITNIETAYALELTDGVNLTSQVYELSVLPNALTITSRGGVDEGEPDHESFGNLLSSYLDGSGIVCDAVSDFKIDPREVNGVSVYPAVFVVRLDAPVSKRTTVTYQTESKYSTTIPERGERNTQYARPDVDYHSFEAKQFVFEAGQSACFFAVDIIDDSTIEAIENFDLKVVSVEGAAIDFSAGVVNVEITDNEPRITIDNADLIVNEGDTYTIPISANSFSTSDIEFEVFIDTGETTASVADYLITPSNGQVLMPSGTNTAGITIEFLEDNDSDKTHEEDEVVVIRTSLDEIFEVEKSTFVINDWRESVAVSSRSNGEEAVDFVIDGSGRVITLKQIINGTASNIGFEVHNRLGEKVSLPGVSDRIISKENINFSPISISFGSERIIVVSEVDGPAADKYFGGTDFVIIAFDEDPEGDSYSLDFITQYGTEEDDKVNGAELFGSSLYAYGTSSGLRLNGDAADIANSGGNDGYLYNISTSNGEVTWSRFIGAEANEDLVSIDVGSRDIITLSSFSDPRQSGRVEALSAESKQTRDQVEPQIISSSNDVNPEDIVYDVNDSSFFVLSHGLDGSAGASGSLTHDTFVFAFNAEFEKYIDIVISSDGTDIGSLMRTMSDGTVVVGGHTDGQFSGQSHSGKNDAFIAIIERDSGTTYKLNSVMQFGTSEDDRVISIRQFNDEKFLVLWAETETDSGQEIYRISAFSMDGKMLSDLPN